MKQPDIPFEPAAPSRAPDPYLEGFAEGRRSMARSIAVKLAGPGEMPRAEWHNYKLKVDEPEDDWEDDWELW